MKTILAIDDKLDNLIIISAILKNLIPETRVSFAQSGEEGLQKADEEYPDTILLDIKMPGMDGFEVCRRLKSNPGTKNIPVIMISAILTGSENLIKGLEAGADAYLSKPINEYILAAQVKTALRIKSAEDQLRKDKKRLEQIILERTTELISTNQQLKNEIIEHKKAAIKIKDVEKQLLHAQKIESIGTLAGGIAHDFNNILFPITGYTELLIEDTKKDDPQMKSLVEILTAVMRAKDLVKQILTFSRQHGHTTKPVEIQSILKEVLQLSRSTLPSTITIAGEIDPNCIKVLADPTQIHQVAMNLITNAFHAMEKNGGRLSVSLKETQLSSTDIAGTELSPGTHACLTISDTGTGMEASTMKRIFDPYFSTKDVDRGTGLGLAVVHGIVKTFHGQIKVKSVLGEGSRFTIYLPGIIPLKEVTYFHKTVEKLAGTESILLIDDEEAICSLMGQILQRSGYKVSKHTKSPEALKNFANAPGKYDLVITDMTMPEMTGVELVRELKKINQKIPVILCTGFSEKATKIGLEKYKINKVLMKPVARNDLLTAVRTTLDLI